MQLPPQSEGRISDRADRAQDPSQGIKWAACPTRCAATEGETDLEAMDGRVGFKDTSSGSCSGVRQNASGGSKERELPPPPPAKPLLARKAGAIQERKTQSSLHEKDIGNPVSLSKEASSSGSPEAGC